MFVDLVFGNVGFNLGFAITGSKVSIPNPHC